MQQIQLINLTPEEFSEILKAAVEVSVRKELSKQTTEQPEQDRYFSRKEAADYLKVCSSGLYQATKGYRLIKGEKVGCEPIPFHRVGRKLLFSRKALDEYVLGITNKTISEN